MPPGACEATASANEPTNRPRITKKPGLPASGRQKKTIPAAPISSIGPAISWRSTMRGCG